MHSTTLKEFLLKTIIALLVLSCFNASLGILNYMQDCIQVLRVKVERSGS